MRVICAVVFCVITFSFLYFYQADVLAMAQHVLSGGVTSYNRTVGALLITLVLYLLQLLVYAISGLYKRAHALTYFPSILALTVLTSVSPRLDTSSPFSMWYIIAPILLIVYGVVVWVLRTYQPFERPWGLGILNRTLWVNLLTLFVFFFFVGLLSNSNDVFHYRMKMESLMRSGKYSETADVGRLSASTDSSLVMLRAYTMARKGFLGDSLFIYPIQGGSSSLLPDSHSVKSLMYPEREIRRFATGIAGDDYRLCGSLLDKDLSRFVRSLPSCYRLDSTSLPKHYGEAVVLFNHRAPHSAIVYKDAQLDSACVAFDRMRLAVKRGEVPFSVLRDSYVHTYWYYYYYVTK